MKHLILLLLAGCVLSAGAADVLHEDVEAAEALAAWTGSARVETNAAGGRFIRITSSATGASLTRTLPVETLRGCTLRARARVQASGLSARPKPWNGVKFMLVVEAPSGRSWPAAGFPATDFDWQDAAFTADIPTNATRLTLVLGLEEVRGAASYDDVRVTIAKTPPGPKPPPAPGPLYTGHAAPRLRGAMVGPRVTAEDLRVLGQEWKANLIRWQLIHSPGPDRSMPLAQYDAWLDGEIARLDGLLPACAQYGLQVALDLHSPPGGKGTVSGYSGSDAGLFTNRAAQAMFVAAWQKLAAHYRGNRVIWGFDLANEPVVADVGEGCDDWPALAGRAGRAVREIDPGRTLIVEAPPWGGPESLRDFRPLPLTNVVYSCHMYVPGAFTHQGVHGRSDPPVEYPGEIKGQRWDAAALERALQPVIDFQRDYNAPIYLGEFSAIRWAPGDSAERYLRDVIGIFEAHGWDWSYHAFREWDGWSVEHGGDRADRRPAAAPTGRQRLLRGWFEKNTAAN